MFRVNGVVPPGVVIASIYLPGTTSSLTLTLALRLFPFEPSAERATGVVLRQARGAVGGSNSKSEWESVIRRSHLQGR